jgi:EcoRII C terminal
MPLIDLKQFALTKGIRLKEQKEIAKIASDNIARRFGYNKEQIKENVDSLIWETEKEAYKVYLGFEKKYGEDVFNAFGDHLIDNAEITELKQMGKILGSYLTVFDRFFLSIAQSRRTRAGNSFESLQNALFKELAYPFDEQKVINGKPDFIMPSYEHFKRNPIDCIIFTAKRTLRERWRQIVTGGTRGLGFFLATIDQKVTASQLAEMHQNRIYLVCPESIKTEKYNDKVNVPSYKQFFKDHLDPSMERWKRNGVI